MILDNQIKTGFIYYYSFQDFKKFMNAVVGSVPRVDFVVGIQRGGLVPATYLSHWLRCPLIVVDYSSKDGNGDNKTAKNEFPSSLSTQGTYLVVDDIADTGNTLQAVKDHIEGFGSKVTTLTLTYKPKSVIIPDYVDKIVDNETWVKYWWEI